MPISQRGLGQPIAIPEGFPGRGAQVCSLGGRTLLAWLPRSARGLHYSIAALGRRPAPKRLAAKRVVSSMDLLPLGDEVLAVWVQEGRTIMEPSELMGAWLPDGSPFRLFDEIEVDIDEVTLVAGPDSPLVVATTLAGGLVIAEIHGTQSRTLGSHG